MTYLRLKKQNKFRLDNNQLKVHGVSQKTKGFYVNY